MVLYSECFYVNCANCEYIDIAPSETKIQKRKKKKLIKRCVEEGRKMHTMYKTIQDEENSNEIFYTVHQYNERNIVAI